MSSVDVIVPCYRYGNFLRQCVESVLSQDIEGVRVLIIDDASPDNTAEVATVLARQNPSITFVRHITNQGHISTYNEGISWASSEYMLLLSADDYLLPGALRRSVKLMEANSRIGFTFGNVFELGTGCKARQLEHEIEIDAKLGSRILKGPEFINISGPSNIVPTPTAVVRTRLQKRIGGYCQELPHSGDLEMWLRFAAHADVGVLKAYQAVYRRHSSNMSLSYTTRGWLPDLEQRKLAFDVFFERHAHLLPDRHRVQRRLLWSLGCCAVGFASEAFNRGETHDADRLCSFALGVSPRVKFSLPWMKLACKRGLGAKWWNRVEPAVNGIRRVVPASGGRAKSVLGLVDSSRDHSGLAGALPFGGSDSVANTETEYTLGAARTRGTIAHSGGKQ